MPKKSSWDRMSLDIVSRLDPDQYGQMPLEVRDSIFQGALEKRYGSPDARKQAQGYARDMGLDRHKIMIRTEEMPPPEGDMQQTGYFDAASKRIAVPKDVDGSTLAHELTHALEDIKGVNVPYDKMRRYGKPEGSRYFVDTSGHFGRTQDFEGQMGYTMAAQNTLERGIPLSKRAIEQMPWLKDVKPQSSNRLTSPWQGLKDELPPELWNEIYK